MPADYIVKQGDTQPALADTLTYSDGSPVNLTGATVALTASSMTAAKPVQITGTVQVTGVANGRVAYAPSAADTSVAGGYMANWVVTFPDATQMTFPTEGYLWWLIEPSLTGEAQALVGLPDVKDYLNVSSTDRSHDSKLLGYIQAATPVIESVAGPIIVRTFDEWHDGGQTWIQLRRRPSSALGTTPILTLMSCDEYRGPVKYPLTVVADPTAATIYSVMLDPRIGTVYRRSTGGGVIPFGAGWTGSTPQSVHVIYQAGQASVPANVRQATLEAIREDYQTTMATGIGSLAQIDTEPLSPGAGFARVLRRIVLEYVGPMRRHPAVA